MERKRLRSTSARPVFEDKDQALYKRAIDKHLGHTGKAPIPLDQALKEEGLHDPDRRRRYHQYRQEEMRVDPQTADDDAGLEFNRRIEERAIARNGRPKGGRQND
ncbi:hypothetical protein SAMN04487974_10734 [Pelagibacterium luteolum]|uniref:Uncharacterized protein n=1 Tax=Pelagibacterium luteolum TaxID=440168 RepID=A0A1G7WPQ8_9HYPH|nr:hypothetical protein SAMN04487974_10734 [Pelagibacterium luteolum]